MAKVPSPELVCNICGNAGPDVDDAYLRVIGATYYGVGGVVRWVNYRCLCCEECYDFGRSMSGRRIWVILLATWLPLMLILVGWLLEVVGGIRGIALPIIAVCLLIWIISFVGGLIYLGSFSRQQIPEFLGKGLDRHLRSLANISKWGLFRHVAILRKIPRKETFVDLPEPEKRRKEEI
jgi:hypothetical protein